MKRLLAGLAFGLAVCLLVPAGSRASDASDSVYVAQDVEGDVTVLRDGKSQPELLREGDEINEGDRVSVGDDGEATLTLGDNQVVRLDGGTQVTLGQFQDNGKGSVFAKFEVAAGNLFAEVKHLLDTQSKFEVDSGGVICGVRGTIFEVSNDDGQVQLQTHEGDVEAVGTGEHVKAGQSGEFQKGRFLRRRALRAAELGRLASWRQFREMVREKRKARLEHRLKDFRNDRMKLLREKLRRAQRRRHRRAVLGARR